MKGANYMNLYYEKEYFLNRDNEIVEIERYEETLNSPYENCSCEMGCSLAEAWNGVASVIDDRAEKEIKEKISEYLDTVYEIKRDPEVEPGEYDSLGIDLINKETGEVENSYPTNWNKQEILDDVVYHEFTDSNGHLDFDEISYNGIDISDALSFKELRSTINQYSYAVVCMSNADMEEFFGVDCIDEITPEQKERAIQGYADILQADLDGEQYCYSLYNRQGEEIDSCTGFYGYDTETNGIEEYVGELVESLGVYNSIENCFEANQEKLGIELAPLPSLEERITLAEEKAASQNMDSKEVNGKDDLEH